MSPLLSIRLTGEPVPYRYELGGPKHMRRIIDADRYAAWKKDAVARMVRWRQANNVSAVAVPVVCIIDAVMDRPRQVQAFATIDGRGIAVPPDWRTNQGRVPCIAPGDSTNLGKAAEDALVQGGLLLDDRLCVRTDSGKSYAAVGEEPCVEVKLYDAVHWFRMLE